METLLLQWIAEVIDYLLCTQATHGADRQCSHEWVEIIAILDKSINSYNDELRLGLCIVRKMEVYEFLLF
jgi:hypothetical protein